MITEDMNDKLTDGYVELLKHLSPNNKLELISKLAQSIKQDVPNSNLDFQKAFGAWDEQDDAEALVKLIRDSRVFNRNIEAL